MKERYHFAARTNSLRPISLSVIRIVSRNFYEIISEIMIRLSCDDRFEAAHAEQTNLLPFQIPWIGLSVLISLHILIKLSLGYLVTDF